MRSLPWATGSVANRAAGGKWCGLSGSPLPASGEREKESGLRRRLGERIDDAVDDLLDERLVLALAHHADHRLGAGGAHDQTSMAVETLDRGLDDRFHLRILERRAVAIAHVLHNLRQRLEAVADFGHGLAVFLHHREHLQRRDEAVA